METPLTAYITPGQEPLTLEEYERVGGYQALHKALQMSPQEVQALVKASNLRGRGGAGFPTGVKWSVVPMDAGARRPKYLVVNADEMEPGTMKDRLLVEGNPHQLIEGALISAYAIQAEVVFIFLRWAYKLAAVRLQRAIDEATARGYLGSRIQGSAFSVALSLHTSAGRYMCGEETGLLNALEGKRATPRSKPPFPQVSGLWGHPTVVNNVETLCNIPHIVNNGAAWFLGLSQSQDGGTKLYGASGRVRRPGVWELPMGTPLREIFTEYAGGMQDGYAFRAVIPGGASTNFLLEDQLDVKMDFASVEQAGSRLGTGTMIVLDDRTCPVGMLFSLEQFFAHESCGWCTPCREGLPWIAKILNALEEGQGEEGDLAVLEHHTRGLAMGHTFCALAPGAVAPLEGALKYFREDFARHISEHRCPWRS
ncbi:MAG TPA: NADH-quinone oxidoreductase subunit NuoF [Armatimonadota bacterium]|jgi:NADH-quinone oxidoreductase subunit F